MNDPELERRVQTLCRAADEILAACDGDETRLDPEQQAIVRSAAGIRDLRTDPTTYVRLPWPDVDRWLGAMRPRNLVVVPAPTGAGKTTFALNLLDAMYERRHKTQFIGLEQKPFELAQKWAAHRCRFDPELVLTGQWEKLPAGAEALITDDMLWQASGDVPEVIRFAPVSFIDADTLVRLTEQAATDGCKLVIVDHVHHMKHGDGRNAFAEFSRTIQEAKEVAKRRDLVVMLMAQMHRGIGDAVKRLRTPPQLSDIRGGGTIEECADLVVALTKIARKGLTKADWDAVRKTEKPIQDLLDPITMRLWCLKKRRSAKPVGGWLDLHCHDGQISQRAPEYLEREDWVPA